MHTNEQNVVPNALLANKIANAKYGEKTRKKYLKLNMEHELQKQTEAREKM